MSNVVGEQVNDVTLSVLFTCMVRLDEFVSPVWSFTLRLSLYVPAFENENSCPVTLVMFCTAVPEYEYAFPPVPPEVVLENIIVWSGLIRHSLLTRWVHVKDETTKVLFT